MDGMEAIRALYLLGIAFAGTVQAETDRAALEEVVVTARRIEERLADVPLSVTVIDGLRLDEFAVTRWEDLTLPGIKIGPGGLLDVLSIRGIASGLNFGFEQSAPVFVDGVWFGSSRSSRSGFVDVERIEILKGPQPTHFGKNAIAGAFGIVTRKPQPEFAASVDAYYEFEHDETAITGVVNVPVSETLAARVAGKMARPRRLHDESGQRTAYTAAARRARAPGAALAAFRRTDPRWQGRVFEQHDARPLDTIRALRAAGLHDAAAAESGLRRLPHGRRACIPLRPDGVRRGARHLRGSRPTGRVVRQRAAVRPRVGHLDPVR